MQELASSMKGLLAEELAESVERLTADNERLKNEAPLSPLPIVP